MKTGVSKSEKGLVKVRKGWHQSPNPISASRRTLRALLAAWIHVHQILHSDASQLLVISVMILAGDLSHHSWLAQVCRVLVTWHRLCLVLNVFHIKRHDGTFDNAPHTNIKRSSADTRLFLSLMCEMWEHETNVVVLCNIVIKGPGALSAPQRQNTTKQKHCHSPVQVGAGWAT